MRFALASDHAGFSLKEEVRAVLESQGVDTRDFGTNRRIDKVREISERHLRPLPPA
jgi:ribose 5-phosphate isomerase RpiB